MLSDVLYGYQVCKASENITFHIQLIHCSQKKSLSNSFSDFLYIKSNFAKFCYFFILTNTSFWMGMAHGCTGVFLRKEEGIQVLAGLTPSSQAVRFWLRTPWPGKDGQKNSAKKWARQNHVIGKIHSTTFDWTHLANSKIGPNRIQLAMLIIIEDLLT